MSALVYVAFIDVGIKILICVFLPYISLDKLVFYAALILLAEILKMGYYIYYCKRFEEAKFKFAWDKTIFKDMWRITFWSSSGSLAYMGYTVGITMLINLFFGPVANAAAGIAGQAVNIINQFRMNFQQAMNPQITKNFAQKNLLDMEKLVIRSSKFSQYLVLVFGIPLFLEAPFLLDIWLKDVPINAVEFLRASLFVTMAITIRQPLVTASLASGDLKRYVIVVTSILMFIIPFTYIAYSLDASPETGSWITFTVTFIALFPSAYMLQRMTGLNFVHFVKGAIIPIVLVTLLSFVAPLTIQQIFQEGWLRLIFVSFVSILSSLGIIYFIGLENGEKYFFKNKSIDILKRIRVVK
jgi:Na+-driven multidrug efflux pump